MKKINVQPERVRAMGNLIPPLSISDFELADCMIHEEDKFKINGHFFNHFSIDVPVTPVNLVLSTQYVSIYPDETSPSSTVITATCTDSAGAPIDGLDVYFQEGGVRLGTASTNAQGIATFEYSSNSGGVHTIRAYTTKQGEYNKSSTEININVFMPTSLTLSPASKTLTTVETATLTSKITNQQGLPLANKLVELYYGDSKVKSRYSGANGIVEFPVSFSELYNLLPKPELVLTGESLIGEVGDDLSLSCQTNLANGAIVNLVRGEDVVSTGAVGADGVVSLIYICGGYGDVEVKAEYMNGSNVYYSNVLNIEDCIIYDAMTSDTGKWINNDAIIDITNEGTQITKNTDGEVNYLLDTPVNYPSIIEFTYIDGRGKCGLGFDGGKINGSSIWFINYWILTSKVGVYSYPTSTATSKTAADVVTTLNKGDKIKAIVEEETIKLYLNDVLLISKKSYKLNLSNVFEFYTNNNYVQKVKDLKIKPYTE